MERLRDRHHLLLVVPAFVVLLAFFAYPLGYGVYMSFVDFRGATFITGEAPFVGFANFEEVLGSPLFARALRNTLVITAVSLALQLVGGLLLALFFDRTFPGSRWMSSVLLLPWLVPLVITTTTWRWILQGEGVFNQTLRAVGLEGANWLSDPTWALWAVIAVNTWAGLPFNSTILGASLRNVPTDIQEAAVLDGAGYWRRLGAITLPLLRPVISVLLILGIVYTLKVLDLVLVLTSGGPANSTQTLALMSYTASFREFQFGIGAAFGNILLVVTMAFALFYARMSRREESS